MPTSYQVALVNATAVEQNVLTNKQDTDANSGSLASTLLTSEYDASSTVETDDIDIVNSAGTAGNDGGWTQTDTNNYNSANQLYQNDTTVAETGQNNANTAVNSTQLQVGQDGTNLSNFLSLANILVSIGSYVSSLLTTKYP